MPKIDARLISEQKLYVFSEVVKHNSITQAARQLCMTQPAVSTIIRQIEEHFDVKLFDLIHKRIHLTPAAMTLYQQWANVRASIENLHQEMDHYKDGISGDIRIVMVSSGKYFVNKAMHLFLKDHPHVRFHCDIRRREPLIAAIENNTYDVGILTDAPYRTELARFAIGDNPLIFVAEPKHPLLQKDEVVIEDLQYEKFIVREPAALITQILLKIFNDSNITLDTLFEFDCTEAVKQSVISGLGIALVPQVCVRKNIEHGMLQKIPVQGINIINQWHVISNQNIQKQRLIQRFLSYIKKNPDLVP